MQVLVVGWRAQKPPGLIVVSSARPRGVEWPDFFGLASSPEGDPFARFALDEQAQKRLRRSARVGGSLTRSAVPMATQKHPVEEAPPAQEEVAARQAEERQAQCAGPEKK